MAGAQSSSELTKCHHSFGAGICWTRAASRALFNRYKSFDHYEALFPSRTIHTEVDSGSKASATAAPKHL